MCPHAIVVSVGFGRHSGGMDSLTVTAAHAATARMDIHEVARQLNSPWDPRLSLRSPALPTVSRRSAGPSPTARPRGLPTPVGGHPAGRAWTHTAGAEGEHVARSWFIGANPVLQETTPLTAIRNDRGDDLMLAVKVLLENTPDT